MFVAINNKDKSAIKIEDMIQRTRNNGEITPEFAMEILSLTNHRSNIKKLVNSVKNICTTKEDIEPYREFILACVDSREVEGEAFDNLREMAKICGCEEEFDKANDKPKFYDKKDCDNVRFVSSRKEFDALIGKNLKVYFDADEVDLDGCNLSEVKGLKFREGAEVYLRGVRKMPEYLDVSKCSKVNLRECDLSGVKEFKFRDGAEVCLNYTMNLPKDLDVSKCSKVFLINCNLNGIKDLKFREGAEVCLSHAINLPKDLDVSMCSKVDLTWCDLSKFKEFKFREGAEVDLRMARKMPEYLDVSMCSSVDFTDCYLSNLKELKLRDKKQMKNFMKGVKNFEDKVVYDKDPGIGENLKKIFSWERN